MNRVFRAHRLTPLASRALSTFALVAAIVVVAGCGDRMQDLQQYVAQTKALHGGQIPPLPQIKPMETFTYDDMNLRSPFVPSMQNLANAGLGGSSCGVHINADRPRQYLEQFPLDSLKMMGTITVKDVMYALIRDGDGVLHRAAVGDYMGQNFGKITQVGQAGLTLREIVPDGQGCWTERTTTVPLGG